MKNVFIGGSRHTSRLPIEIRNRLDEIAKNQCTVFIGDANGIDKAVQQYLNEISYRNVKVFCSGSTPRNNLGRWQVQCVHVPKSTKGFSFYAAKDREMADGADLGLMVWDGESPGTLLNVLRLIQRQKTAVVINVKDQTRETLRSSLEWREFFAKCAPQLREALRERATPEEWRFGGEPQIDFFVGSANKPQEKKSEDFSYVLEAKTSTTESDTSQSLMNAEEALRVGDDAGFVANLKRLIEIVGLSTVAKRSGMTPKALEKSLAAKNGVKLNIAIKTVQALGYNLQISSSKQ